MRSGQPIHQGGDLHVHGKVAALLHLRDNARQVTLRYQLCAGSAQRLANACQDFTAKNKSAARKKEQNVSFLLNAYRKMHITVMSLSSMEKN